MYMNNDIIPEFKNINISMLFLIFLENNKFLSISRKYKYLLFFNKLNDMFIIMYVSFMCFYSWKY